ncbi:hypothetical protein N7G274_009869 [Stereocaulon virgatum]|uniref:BTB domain-containing protein n=1 Tax=Stereocaulon virgatum TaxID=373712 RepID=A0ABR3ZXX5_9LECA
MTITTPYEADPAGDLTLLVGPDQRSIRVCSKVLSLASPVFAAMMGPKFAEGRALLGNQLSSPSPITISLPEDDVEAMVLFCTIIHFKEHATPNVSFPVLEKLAFLCDKYDAARALSSASEVWMSPFPGSKDGESSFLKVLWISYALGNHRNFWKASRAIVQNYTRTDLLEQRHSIEDTALPPRILDSIDAEREAHLRRFVTTLQTILIPHLTAQCPSHSLHGTINAACGHLMKSGHYIQELHRLQLWPMPDSDSTKSLRDIYDRFYGLQRCPIVNPWCHNSQWDVAKIDCTQLLMTAGHEILAKPVGLCLNCVRDGRIMRQDGNCQKQSLELCKDIVG